MQFPNVLARCVYVLAVSSAVSLLPHSVDSPDDESDACSAAGAALHALHDKMLERTFVIDCRTRIPADQFGGNVNEGSATQEEFLADLVVFSRERWEVSMGANGSLRMTRVLTESHPAEAGTVGDWSIRIVSNGYIRSLEKAYRNGSERVLYTVYDAAPLKWSQHPIIDSFAMQIAYLPWGTTWRGLLEHPDTSCFVSADAIEAVNDGMISNCVMTIRLRRSDNCVEAIRVDTIAADGRRTTSRTMAFDHFERGNLEPGTAVDVKVTHYNPDGSVRRFVQHDLELIDVRPIGAATDLFRVDVPAGLVTVDDTRYGAAYRIGENTLTLDGVPYRTDRAIGIDAVDDLMTYVDGATNMQASRAGSVASRFEIGWGLVLAGVAVGVIAVVLGVRRGK